VDQANSDNRNVACVVDGYSTGAQLARAFRDAGWSVIHVQSAAEIPGPFRPSFQPDTYDQRYTLPELGFEPLVVRLTQAGPRVVVAGSEPGTPLADALAAALGTPGNDPATSRLRRNKYEMAEALRRANVRAVRQQLVSDEAQAARAAESFGSWPAVVKPVDSAGSEGVSICYDADEVRDAFRRIHKTTTLFGAPIEQVLVQEYLKGSQYVVNAVSVASRHRITEMWKEDRLVVRGVGNLYDKEVMVPFEGAEQTQLRAYTKQALDVLGIRNGASHTEVMYTGEGPVLIETGARMQGGIVSTAVTKVLNDSHMTMTLKSYLDPAAFLEQIDAPYRMNASSMVVNLISPRAGTVKENNCEQLMATLPSFYLVARSPQVGTQVQKTVDLLTKTGHIYLMHEDPGQLEKDYQQIRAWEREERLIVLQ
jgi:L-amino acid ligase